MIDAKLVFDIKQREDVLSNDIYLLIRDKLEQKYGKDKVDNMLKNYREDFIGLVDYACNYVIDFIDNVIDTIESEDIGLDDDD